MKRGLIVVAALIVSSSGPRPVLAGGEPTATPIPSSTPLFTYVVAPKLEIPARPGYPEILRVELNSRHFVSRDEIVMQVVTSTNVVKVVTHEAGGRGGTLTESAPGIFNGSGRVAGIPFFIRQLGVTLHFTATTAEGKSTTVNVPVHFKR